jgi:hypothetical protein
VRSNAVLSPHCIFIVLAVWTTTGTISPGVGVVVLFILGTPGVVVVTGVGSGGRRRSWRGVGWGRRYTKKWKVRSSTILSPHCIVIVLAVWTPTRTITPGVGVGVLFIVHVLVATGAVVDGRWGRWRWRWWRKRHIGACVVWTTPRIETQGIRIIIPVGVAGAGIIVPIVLGG